MLTQPDIPQEQLDRIQPLVDNFLTAFRRIELTLPLETDLAPVYRPEPEHKR